jgi:hypothetical protein
MYSTFDGDVNSGSESLARFFCDNFKLFTTRRQSQFTECFFVLKLDNHSRRSEQSHDIQYATVELPCAELHVLSPLTRTTALQRMPSAISNHLSNSSSPSSRSLYVTQAQS